MPTITKKQKQLKEILGDKIDKDFTPQEAVKALKDLSTKVKRKFDETVELAVRLGIDAKQSDQQVRSSVSLPGGTGKKVRIAVVTKGERVKDAETAGADIAGSEDLVAKIEGGWLEFDKLVATPDVMPLLGKLGKVLGPKGLMPNPKDGTVANDVTKAIKELKAGKASFRAEKDSGIVHLPIGKISFDEVKILQNLSAAIDAILKAKPSGAKGQYIKSVYVSTSMGPGLKINNSTLDQLQEFHV